MAVQVIVWYRFSQGDALSAQSAKRVKSLVTAIQLYPTALIFTWLPNIVSEILYIGTPSNENTEPVLVSLGVTNSIGLLFGTVLSVAFFYNSKEARQRWYYLIAIWRDQSAAATEIVIIDDDEYVVEEHVQVRISARNLQTVGISDAALRCSTAHLNSGCIELTDVHSDLHRENV